MSRTTEQPVRPGTKQEHPPAVDAEQIVRERLKTFEQDAKTAEDWLVVKARILQQKPQP